MALNQADDEEELDLTKLRYVLYARRSSEDKNKQVRSLKIMDFISLKKLEKRSLLRGLVSVKKGLSLCLRILRLASMTLSSHGHPIG
jgi:hypothetical protein